ncbi:MAG: carbohydrate ABC transporter substrate-binding protein [Oscillospiraceae bacterium]|nr:carbohydrate ABC transporter substrate-binding protein [Oscillospiraceae bacterium]
MMKKVLAGIMGVAMLASLTACGSEGTTDNGGDAAETVAGASEGPVTLKFSWWGGDSRHEATQKAVEAFMAKYNNITVETNFGAWSGWEDSMSTAFYAGTAPDVNQVNWNWISNYSADGSIFLDMNKVSNTFDLTQYDQSALDQCTVAGELQAIPVSMTGRIFYWNESTFEKAGISTPKTLEELYAAGETFKTVLGDDYYPLALGEYDRAILCVYYLESVYGKAWVTDGKLNYTAEEIATGLQFIEDLEAKHVIPTVATILGDGAESLDKNPKWMEGKYAGIFEWDSSATKFGGALNEGQSFIVGDYMKDMGEYQGGFSKVSLAFAITENTKYPTESAMLMQYLLNDPEGSAIMASERGIPLSKAANATCKEQGLLNEMVAEANGKVLAWVDFPLDTQFENSKLKGAPDGVYYDVFGGLSYDEYTVEDAAKVLVDGVTAVLEG